MYKRLKLPHALDESAIDQLIQLKKNKTGRVYVYTTEDVDSFISKELSDSFKTLNVYPHVMVAFGHIDNPKLQHQPFVHSDIEYTNSKWQHVPFAINYEITNTVAVLKWWDPYSDIALVSETGPTNIDEVYASGVHYGQRGNRDTSKYKCIDRCVLTNAYPVLIRTDIPHTVDYPMGYQSRISVSFRFPLKQISTWEKALELWCPLSDSN